MRPLRHLTTHAARAAVMALLVTGLARPVHAQLTAADSATFLRVTRVMLDAITYGDTSALAPHLASSWFITDEEGEHIPRAQFLAELRGLPPGQSGELQVGRLYLVGTAGVAVMSYDIDEQHNFYGQHLRTRFHATDTWVREGGEWRMLASQMTALPTPASGRPVAREVLMTYAGRYALTDSIMVDIVVDDGGLSMARPGRPGQRLHALDDRIFIRHGVRGFWLFEREDGRVTRLVNWRDNNAVIWRRR